MHIVIIGAGFAGTALAVALLTRGGGDVGVTLVSRSGAPGQGPAYGIGTPCLKLDRSVREMSVRADQPHHLVEWLFRRRFHIGAIYRPDSYIPRELYGQYLEETLASAAALSSAAFRLVRSDVTAVQPDRVGYRIELGSGETLAAGQVALATGLTRRRPRAASGRPIVTAFAPGALAQMDERDPVLIVGTGPSMADQVLLLNAAGHQGPITAISRHGLAPLAHQPVAGEAKPPPGLRPATGLLPMVRMVRDAVADAAGNGEDWRPVIDGTALSVPTLWQSLSAAEKLRALRHLRPFWKSHRHRIPPEAGAVIDACRASGRLRILAGTITAMEVANSRIDVTVRPRGSHETRRASFARVILCPGPARTIAALPLLGGMMEAGMIRPGPARLGVDIAADATALAPDGARNEGLFAVGGLSVGALYETIPEAMRQQCARVAGTMLERIKSDAASWQRPELAAGTRPAGPAE
ncbi:FAD/NAD(P)-binding protein [Acuticoccus sp. M5D2P5]|uniref:FAD/NAD(P)-binding protein n=1 Tax=Acuticoccus kalidii TaxID=2910977 RepID=UPI001F17A771|nr:FAD/NAD(P)-binding protein [Acuticoccus kalidii]